MFGAVGTAGATEDWAARVKCRNSHAWFFSLKFTFPQKVVALVLHKSLTPTASLVSNLVFIDAIVEENGKG